MISKFSRDESQQVFKRVGGEQRNNQYLNNVQDC